MDTGPSHFFDWLSIDLLALSCTSFKVSKHHIAIVTVDVQNNSMMGVSGLAYAIDMISIDKIATNTIIIHQVDTIRLILMESSA